MIALASGYVSSTFRVDAAEVYVDFDTLEVVVVGIDDTPPLGLQRVSDLWAFVDPCVVEELENDIKSLQDDLSHAEDSAQDKQDEIHELKREIRDLERELAGLRHADGRLAEAEREADEAHAEVGRWRRWAEAVYERIAGDLMPGTEDDPSPVMRAAVDGALARMEADIAKAIADALKGAL